MIYQGSARTPVREAILHCAAIRTGQFDGMRAFQVFATINRWHKERGFNSFGYHALIMPDGHIYSGRPFTKQGAHVLGHNRGTLGILLIEKQKIEEIREFSDYYTPNQRYALRDLLRSVHGIGKVSGHNDYAAKLCPGFKVQSEDWLE